MIYHAIKKRMVKYVFLVPLKLGLSPSFKNWSFCPATFEIYCSWFLYGVKGAGGLKHNFRDKKYIVHGLCMALKGRGG